MSTPPAALYRSLVDDAFGFIVAIRPDFTVELVGRSVTAHLGWQPEELAGTNVADFVHPDDLERALLLLGGWSVFGAPNGNASFRLRHTDGRWMDFDVTASHVTDGAASYLGVYCTPIDYQHATDEVLARLLRGADRKEALTPVLDVFSWQLNDAQIAIAWDEDGTTRHVSTGLPAELSGATDEPGTPWSRARETGEPVLDADQSTLPPSLAALAAEHGRGGVWVVPVDDASAAGPALVTVWSRRDGPRPDGHSYGMSVATTYIELILRWTHQVAQLRDAARRDPLTGLANRNALFEAMDSDDGGGVLLYCDLDRFKQVNDRHGHTVGDQVLRTIAQRIGHTVGPRHLVARSGGDEFVVLAFGLDQGEAEELAHRIIAAVDQPLGDAVDLSIGVTIGAAEAPERFTEATLADADRALMAAKGTDRGTVRWDQLTPDR